MNRDIIIHISFSILLFVYVNYEYIFGNQSNNFKKYSNQTYYFSLTID